MKNQSVWDRAGAFITGLIARWTFKVLSGVLVTLGVTADQWYFLVASAIAFLIGALITVSQNRYIKSA